jgi:hypothetical protein
VQQLPEAGAALVDGGLRGGGRGAMAKKPWIIPS